MHRRGDAYGTKGHEKMRKDTEITVNGGRQILVGEPARKIKIQLHRLRNRFRKHKHRKHRQQRISKCGCIIGWIRYQNGTAYANNMTIVVSGNENSGSITATGSLGSGGIVGLAYNHATVTGNTNTAASISGGTLRQALWADYSITNKI